MFKWKKKSHTSLTLNCKNAKFFFKLNRKPEARRSGVWSTFFNRKSCWKPRQRTARLRHQVSQVAVISVGEVVYHLVHKTPSHPLLRGTKRKQRKPRLQSYLLIARLWLSGLVFWTSVSTSLKWGETSLMVQWLRYHACTAGGAGSIPGPGTKLPYACLSVWQKKKKNHKIKWGKSYCLVHGIVVSTSFTALDIHSFPFFSSPSNPASGNQHLIS